MKNRKRTKKKQKQQNKREKKRKKKKNSDKWQNTDLCKMFRVPLFNQNCKRKKTTYDKFLYRIKRHGECDNYVVKVRNLNRH